MSPELLGYASIAVLTLVCAWLAGADALWEDSRQRAIAAAAWLPFPFGAYASGRFVDGDGAATVALGTWLLVWLLLSMGGRPALLMTEMWPNAVTRDRSGIARLARRRTTVFLGGAVLVGIVWGVLMLADKV